MYPDLEKKVTSPTRGDALLDYSYTNFESSIVKHHVCHPIESEENKSDHKISQEAVAQCAKACTSEQRVLGSNPATAWLDF